MSPAAPRPALPEPLRARLEDAVAEGRLELPFLPDTASQVLAACNDERCDARELSELLQRDQALAGHVLRIANSAAYAPKEPIVSLRQAVSRLGYGTICEIAVSVSVQGRVFRVPGYQVRIREMWVHSAMTACYAKEVARLRRTNAEGAFLCGLLHDVGRPVVLQAFLDMLHGMTEKQIPFPLLESGMDAFHERVGAVLVREWKLPDWMAVAIGHHHDPAAAGEDVEGAATTSLACRLARWAVSEKAKADTFDRGMAGVAALDLYDDDVDALLERRGDVLEVAEAFL